MQSFMKRCWAHINLDHLVHNLEHIRTLVPGAEVMAVVKANAYGPVSYTHLDVYKRQVVRLFGERRSNGVSEFFVLCTETSDTKFVTTKHGNTAVRLRGRNRKTTFRQTGKKVCPQ